MSPVYHLYINVAMGMHGIPQYVPGILNAIYMYVSSAKINITQTHNLHLLYSYVEYAMITPSI